MSCPIPSGSQLLCLNSIHSASVYESRDDKSSCSIEQFWRQLCFNLLSAVLPFHSLSVKVTGSIALILAG